MSHINTIFNLAEISQHKTADSTYFFTRAEIAMIDKRYDDAIEMCLMSLGSSEGRMSVTYNHAEELAKQWKISNN